MDLSRSGVNTCQAEMNGVISCPLSLLEAVGAVVWTLAIPSSMTEHLAWFTPVSLWMNYVQQCTATL